MTKNPTLRYDKKSNYAIFFKGNRLCGKHILTDYKIDKETGMHQNQLPTDMDQPMPTRIRNINKNFQK